MQKNSFCLYKIQSRYHEENEMAEVIYTRQISPPSYIYKTWYLILTILLFYLVFDINHSSNINKRPSWCSYLRNRVGWGRWEENARCMFYLAIICPLKHRLKAERIRGEAKRLWFLWELKRRDKKAQLDTLSHFFNADGLGLPIIFNALTWLHYNSAIKKHSR